MDNPVLIQKQIKDNAEDLHNFVRDMQLWEEEMKRKDRQLSKDRKDEILPPVRRAKIPKKEPILKIKDDKRIPSYDYKKWDNFDVEKACEEVDNEEDKNNMEEDNDEETAKQEEKYQKEKALYEKEIGNRCVKACKWDEAIEAYTRALAAYPRDPVFYANRALCYLKKNKYERVEADCTESLKLDPTYVKALLRRAAAREALDRLEAARHDLRQVLQLEPNNQQARRDLDRVTAAGLAGTKKNILKKKDSSEKLTEEGSSQKDTLSVKSPSLKESKNAINQQTSDNNTKTGDVTELSGRPMWEPCSHTIEPVSKPPHLRSKKPLKRIEVFDVGTNIPKHESARKSSKLGEPPKNTTPDTPNTMACTTTATSDDGSFPTSSAVSSAEDPVPSATPATSAAKSRSILTVNTSMVVGDVPPIPKTSVQFHTSWNSIKFNRSLCYRFLKQIPGETLPDIFKESLESQMFSGLVEILATEFIAAGEPVLSYLRGLSQVRRFSTIVLFMSPADKSNLSKLFEHCTNKQECSKVEADQLRRLYED